MKPRQLVRAFTVMCFALLGAFAGILCWPACEKEAAAGRVAPFDASPYDGDWVNGEPVAPSAPSDAGAEAEAGDASTTDAGGAFESFHCRDELVFCIDPRGNPLIDRTVGMVRKGEQREDLVPQPEPGDIVYIRVVGKASEVAGNAISLSTDATIDPAARTFKGAGDGGAPPPTDGGVDDDVVLVEIIAVMQDTSALRVHYKVTDGTDAQRVVLERSYTLPVQRSISFHFEAALFVPIVSRGSRQIHAVPIPGSNSQVAHVSEDTQIAFGLAFNYFPFGISGSGPWTQDACPDDHCPLKQAKKLILEPLGMQAGATLDFTKNTLQEWFIGLAFEPIRGGSLSAGFSFVQGTFFVPGFSEGMLLPNGTLPVGSTETKYMVRPYFGLTVSPEIAQTLLNVLAQVKSVGKGQGASP